MPLSPPRRRPALTVVNLSLANADQNLTEVGTRLTKVDTVNPRPNPKPSKTRQNRNRARHPDTSASTLAVNPSNTPRTNLNKSEQTRTPPNAPTR